jgi:hypothetical protein
LKVKVCRLGVNFTSLRAKMKIYTIIIKNILNKEPHVKSQKNSTKKSPLQQKWGTNITLLQRNNQQSSRTLSQYKGERVHQNQISDGDEGIAFVYLHWQSLHE